MDRKTIELIRDFKIEEFWKQIKNGTCEMCGSVPVAVGMLFAKERKLKPHVLTYANSGDVTGDKGRVVGYTAISFSKTPSEGSPVKEEQKEEVADEVDPLSLVQKRRLIEIAKNTIVEYVQNGKKYSVKEADPRLKEIEGAFVTIHKNGQLRGCIGNIIGRQPLYLTVRDMAIAACSQDPRFVPVKEEELPDLDIEVSVLSVPRVTTNVEEIVMGTHGVIVSRGFGRSGVFLPQVATETGWTREQFLSNLCAHKAGLPPNAWKDPKTRIEIFTADVFSEDDVQ